MIRTLIALCCGMALPAATAGINTTARTAAPVYVANQNPFIQIFGLPRAEPGTITPKGKLEAGFLYYVSNNSISLDAANGETITWDGETAQYTLRFRYGAVEWLELGVDIPMVQHSGGYLDSFIRNYHNIMGLPNDRQEQFGKDQINFQITDNGTVVYAMNEPQSGPGDVRLTAAVPLLRGTTESRRYLAMRSLLKLPTGESQDLLGSGGTDISIGLAYSDYEILGTLNTILTAHAGLIYLGESDILASMQNRYAGYGGMAADWQLLNWLDLKLQLDFHSAMYDSELKQLGSSTQLLSGGAVRLPGDIHLDFGISQQLITDATPDVGFYLMARYLF